MEGRFIWRLSSGVARVWYELEPLKKRLIHTCVRLPVALLVGAAFWVMTAKYVPTGAAEILQLLVAVAVVLRPFSSVNRLIRKQEVEADLHAVIQFGADPQAMITALERLDKLNGRNSSVAHGAHPSTTERISELRSLIPATPLKAGATVSEKELPTDQGNKAA